MTRHALLLAALALGACGGAPKPELAPVPSRVAEANARAAAMVRIGDDETAARHYEEALRMARSVEDVDAIAANAINLSVVYQWLGRNDAARQALATVLDDRRLPFSERHRVQAELRRAILDSASKDAEGAARWLRQADERCKQSCELAATIANVQAQLALEAGRTAEAAQFAERAAGLARSRQNRAEEGNALRNLGRARNAAGDPAGAVAALEQALVIDRALADPRKIFADLMELARASNARGDREAATAYMDRAKVIARAAREARGIEEMGAQLRLERP